jgi:hypothetical protein
MEAKLLKQLRSIFAVAMLVSVRLLLNWVFLSLNQWQYLASSTFAWLALYFVIGRRQYSFPLPIGYRN